MTKKFHQRRHPAIQALIDKKNVMAAVMLRDMRSRFFNHGIGFIVVPLWPLVHMFIIIMIHSYARQAAATYGDSAAIFFMTGVLPFLAFSYVSRFMAFSLVTNRSMLAFPAVKSSDILMGRAALEIVAGFVTLFCITTIFYAMGEDPYPFDLQSATECYLSTLYLAFGCGYFVGVCTLIFPMTLTAYQFIIIALYISSGIFFVASNLPDGISYYLSYNPVVQCIEWLRTAYFQSYSDKLVNVTYILSFATIMLFLALALERFVARHVSDR